VVGDGVDAFRDDDTEREGRHPNTGWKVTIEEEV
jgi:nucleoid DNA-binding protein